MSGDRLSLDDVARAHGNLRREGSDLRGSCPVCGATGKTERNFWAREHDGVLLLGCNFCGEGGDFFKAALLALGLNRRPQVQEKPLARWQFVTADGRRRAMYRWRCDCGGRSDCEKCHGKGTYKRLSKPRPGVPELADLLYVPRRLEVRDGEAVYLCEGGSSADALAGLGLSVVAWPGARPSVESLRRLPAGPLYRVWPDHDATGYRQAIQFGEALAGLGLGHDVRAVDPLKVWPDAPAKWDPRDWAGEVKRAAGAASGGDSSTSAVAGPSPAFSLPPTLESAIVPLSDLESRAGPATATGSATGAGAGAGGDSTGSGFGAVLDGLLRDLASAPVAGVEGLLRQIQQATVEALAVDAPGGASTGGDAVKVGLIRAAAVAVLRKLKIAGAREIVEAVIVGRPEADSAGGGAITWPKVEAAEAPQSTVAILSDVAAHLRRFVAWPDGGDVAVACWIVWSWVSDRGPILPVLALTSPVKQCGKTTALDVIGCFVGRPVTAANVTGPAMFRLIEAERPCLLLDEVDRWLREDQGGERIGILNAGHRRGGKVIRCVGDDYEPRTFAVDSPKVLAGIGELPDTLADRSVTITLERVARGSGLERFRGDRHPDPEMQGRLLRWANDHAEAFGNVDPDMGALANRPADNWRPLFAVAELAGGEWPGMIRAAADLLMDRASARASSARYPEMLLADTREVFRAAGDPAQMTGRELDEALHGMGERPWATCSRGKPLTAQKRGRWLATFGVQSRTLHGSRTVPGASDAKGYLIADLHPAWARYLNAGGSEPSEPSAGNDYGGESRSPNRPHLGGRGRFNGSENVNVSGGADGSDGSTTPAAGYPADRDGHVQSAGLLGSADPGPLGSADPGLLGSADPPASGDGEIASVEDWEAALEKAKTQIAAGELRARREQAEGWRKRDQGPYVDRWPESVPSADVEAQFRDPKSGRVLRTGRAFVRLDVPAPFVEVDPPADTNGRHFDPAEQS